MDSASDPEQVFGSLSARHPAPRAIEGGARRPDGVIHVGGAGFSDLGERLLVRRVDGLDGLAGAGPEPAVDEDAIGGSKSRDIAGFRCGGVLESWHVDQSRVT